MAIHDGDGSQYGSNKATETTSNTMTRLGVCSICYGQCLCIGLAEKSTLLRLNRSAEGTPCNQRRKFGRSSFRFFKLTKDILDSSAGRVAGSQSTSA